VVVESKRYVGVVVAAEVIRGVRHESNEIPQAGSRCCLVLRSQICRQILGSYQRHEFIHGSEPPCTLHDTRMMPGPVEQCPVRALVQQDRSAVRDARSPDMARYVRLWLLCRAPFCVAALK
jgi:hypothetical protein